MAYLLAMTDHVGDKLGGQPVGCSQGAEGHEAPHCTHCFTLHLVGCCCLLHKSPTSSANNYPNQPRCRLSGACWKSSLAALTAVQLEEANLPPWEAPIATNYQKEYAFVSSIEWRLGAGVAPAVEPTMPAPRACCCLTLLHRQYTCLQTTACRE